MQKGGCQELGEGAAGVGTSWGRSLNQERLKKKFQRQALVMTVEPSERTQRHRTVLNNGYDVDFMLCNSDHKN